MQAAIRAAGQASPNAAPPPPPPPSSTPSFSAPSPPSSAPPPPNSRAQTQPPIRSMLDPSSYTLSSNGSLPKSPSPNRNSEPARRVFINDPRWKFQDEGILPKPRDFYWRGEEVQSWSWEQCTFGLECVSMKLHVKVHGAFGSHWRRNLGWQRRKTYLVGSTSRLRPQPTYCEWRKG